MSYYQVPHFCGVYYLPPTTVVHHHAAPSWLPQVSLSTNSRLYDTASSTVLTQTFLNPSKTSPIEKAKYNFPLYESCAVVSFRCFIGKRLIEGVVKEKEEAKATYDEAVARGETAGLLEQKSPDVFSTSLGNIPAGETVKVEVEYIMELKHDAGADGLRFTIPTSIAPRYGQAPSGLNTHSDGQPIPGALQSGMMISVQVTMPSNIRAVQSPSHTISMHLGGHVEDVPDDQFNPKHALATLSQTSTELGTDFVLLVKCADLSSPRALLETHPTLPNSKALMVTLVPKFTLPPGPKPEIVFIVDRSGSMIDRMAPLISALSVFLRSLPVGVKFNICSFGSKYSFLWQKSQPYSGDTLDEAQKHVESMVADFGGTEIFEPVKATIKQRFKDIPLEMMVLTDGEVWNTQQLLTYLEKETAAGDIRLFSLGIGQDVSHSLVEGMARVGRGFAQVVLDETEGIEGKVVRMLRAGLSAHVKDYRLEWDSRPPEQAAPAAKGTSAAAMRGKKISLFDTQADADTPILPKSGTGRYAHLPDFAIPAVLQAPYKLPSLFPFSRFTAYAIFSGDVPAPSSVWLRGTTPSGDELELEIAVQVVPENSRTVHQLAARKILQGLEEGNGYMHSGKYGIDPGTFDEWVAREGTRVGVTYGLASNWTSFVAVEKKKGKETASKEIIDDGVQRRIHGVKAGFRCLMSASPQHGGRGVPVKRKTRMALNNRARSDTLVSEEPSTRMGRAIMKRSLGFSGVSSTSSSSPIHASLPDVWFSAPPSASSSNRYCAPAVISREQHKTFSLREQAVALIALQTFEGSFPLTAVFAATLDVRLPDLEAKLMEFVPVGAPLKGSQALGDEHDELVEEPLPPNVTEKEQTEWKRRQNTLAARKSRRRKLQHQMEEQKKRLWATVLAVGVFEGKLRDEKEMWELVVEKARGWVVLSAAGEDVQRLEVMAREVLGG